MFCSNCGNQMPDGTRFCAQCGAAQTPPTHAQTPPPPPGDYAPQGMTPRPGGEGTSKTVWIILACAGIVVIALAVALPLLLLRGGGEGTEDTVVVSTTTVTTPATTETTEAPEPATTETTEAPESTTTTTKPAATIPGDSAGRWSETSISGIEQSVNQVAVSDDALLLQVGGNQLAAYLFDSGKTVLIPTSATTVGAVDIDGLLAVWWEADGADVITDAHIYAMRLPGGPKVEVASGTGVAYPQVAKGMITWVEGKPWAAEPDAWWDFTIKAAAVDKNGKPSGAAATLVDYGSAIAATLGDSTWSYSLSEGFLAWEQQSEAGDIGMGSYVMDLASMEPWNIDSGAWRPSLDKNRVVFTLDGVGYADFLGNVRTLDPAADFATAAPTYAAYYRPTPSGDGTSWAVMAKGYTGKYEQVLLDDTGNPPWFLPPIAASGHHVAFALDGKLRLFTWQE